MLKQLFKSQTNRFFLCLLLVIFLPSCAESLNSSNVNFSEEQTTASSVVQNQSFTYENYAEVLQKYVDLEGKVDYQGLKENRQALDRFNQSLGRVSPQTYEAWSNEEKIAFLINAYNSLTLASIIDNYPTKSIRDISGVWKGRKFTVIGQEMTLDEIEHQVLRKQFDEPRIHLGLVCASISCPKLITEPYTGEELNRQLDQQTRLFLANPDNFKINYNDQKVYVSSIFKWFGQDFENQYGQKENIKGLNKKESSFLTFMSQYLSPLEAEYITQGGYNVGYLDYDWSLNEQK